MDLDYIKLSSNIINYSGLLFSVCSTFLMFYVAWINKDQFPFNHSSTHLIYVTLLVFVMSFLRYIVLYDIEQITKFSPYRNTKPLVINLCLIEMLMYSVIFITTLFIVIYYVLFNELTALQLWIFVMITFIIISMHIEIISTMNNENIQMSSTGRVHF